MTLFYYPLSIVKVKTNPEPCTGSHGEYGGVRGYLGNLSFICIVLLFLINESHYNIDNYLLNKLQLNDVYCHLIIQIMLQNQVRVCKMPLMYENYRLSLTFSIHN